DIYDGTLQGFSEISSPLLKSKIAPLLKPQKKRALYLESLLKDHSELYPKHYWNTELITCWTGGTVGYKSQNLYRYYGDCPVRDIGYVSCEGRHTIPLAEGTPAGPLIPDGAFYEFIPLGATKTKLAHELDIGREYLILVTTSNGLYRYKIDDIVCCRGYLEQTPVLEFIRKTSDYSDMEGEKLSAQQVISAVRDVANKHNVNILDFGFAGERRENLPPRYKIYLEPLNDVQIDPKALFQLAEDIDKHLISSNLCYCQKRSDGSLDSLNPVILPKGTWHKFMSSLSSKRKTGETQYKHPVILSSQQHAELQGLL
ncbi:MAG: GH3 auxin-responsive promoter family protein, partial [Hyphomicrobium sp.]